MTDDEQERAVLRAILDPLCDCGAGADKRIEDHSLECAGVRRITGRVVSSLDVKFDGDFVLVRGELTPGRTLTNDAQNVIATLSAKDALNGRRVLYEDSEGTWDEMLHANSRFTTFAPIGGVNAEDAIRRARGTSKVYRQPSVKSEEVKMANLFAVHMSRDDGDGEST